MAPLPFSTFMEKALFDPDAGYYSKNIATIGRRGDFSTSPTLSPSLSQSIAGWLKQCWRENNSLPHTVIEIGGGDGSMAHGILRHLGIFGRRKLQYHIVETSPPLRKQQIARLGDKRRCQWHLDMKKALVSTGGKAFIISNELVDAFPAELLQWNANKKRWHEILLEHDGTQWIPIPGNPVELPAVSSLQNKHNFTDGQRVERHDSYLKWLTNWLPSWHLGEMLTIDYGDLFPGIYHRRPKGTLRAYFAQQRLESLPEILSRPGKQDLTADVDFSDLRTRTAQLGLREIAFQTQVEFITGQQVKACPQDPAINPHGAGNAFKVLWHRRC
jgi:SAM-dependent MidA family methyltransferase